MLLYSQQNVGVLVRLGYIKISCFKYKVIFIYQIKINVGTQLTLQVASNLTTVQKSMSILVYFYLVLLTLPK